MLTNILDESTELLCCGAGAKERIMEAFELPRTDAETIMLNGVVSRKKQFIPIVMTYLQQI